MQQRALIVTDDVTGSSLENLNQSLLDGWKVITACPMPSACSVGGEFNHVTKMLPTCLVVIEKE